MPELSWEQPFEEALEFFRAKGYELSPGGWAEVWKDANASAFTVARVTEADLLADIKTALESAMEEGKTFQQFYDELLPTLQTKGWLGSEATAIGFRLANIFETNLASAYNVGRWIQIQQVKATRPYLEYAGIKDKKTRRLHLLQFGKVYPVDHPFWSTWYPPNGFRCRCYVRSLSSAYVAENGLTVSTEIEMVKNADGTWVMPMPDKGWDYNVGQAGMNVWKPKLIGQ